MLRRRSIMTMTLLQIALALPAAAQQMLSEQEARKVAESVLDSWNKAFAARDPAGIAVQYTEDYVFVGPPPREPMAGRAAMEKNWSENFEGYSPNPDTLDQVRLIGNDAIWVLLTWSGTSNGPKGPEQEKGRTARVYVRDGDTWKIRMELWNYGAPPS